jgi:hypothetical protein
MKDRAADWSGVSPAVGFWSAWITAALNFCYVAAAVAAGAAQGVPRDSYWAVAETLAIVGPVALVLLMAAIQGRPALPGPRTLGTMALGWMLAFAVLTITVHFVELTVARRIDFASSPELRRIFGFEWPSSSTRSRYWLGTSASPRRCCALHSPSGVRAASGWCALGLSRLERFVSSG